MPDPTDPDPRGPAGPPELTARLHPDPPLWFARLLAALVKAKAEGRDVAYPGWERLLELGHADDGWLLLPLAGDGLDREPRTLPILMLGGEELAAVTSLPGPASGRQYLAGQLEQARTAMGLALSALRAWAYTGPSTAAPTAGDLSRQRGEAMDALGLALGHTQGRGVPEVPGVTGPLADTRPQHRSPRVDPTRLEAIEATQRRHSERLAHLETLAGVEPPF